MINIMNILVVFFSFLLLTSAIFLTVYNVLYSVRIKTSTRGIGFGLPDGINRLFTLALVSSFAVTFLLTMVFIYSLFNFKLPSF